MGFATFRDVNLGPSVRSLGGTQAKQWESTAQNLESVGISHFQIDTAVPVLALGELQV